MNQKNGYIYVTEEEYFEHAEHLSDGPWHQILVTDEKGEVQCSISANGPYSRLREDDEPDPTLLSHEEYEALLKILENPPPVPQWLRDALGDKAPEKPEPIEVSPETYTKIVRMVLNPPAPPQALIDLFRDHHKD